jgi:nitroreductase
MHARPKPFHGTKTKATNRAAFSRRICLHLPLLVLLGTVAGCKPSSGSEAKPLEIRELPAPALNQASLKDALKNRVSTRVFKPGALDDQTLSNLLWAANGINRPTTGGRTAPSAFDWRHVDVYLADAQGLWRYNATRNAVERLGKTDVRSLTGVQDFVKDAPLDLILVSDEGKMDPKEPEEMRTIFTGVGVGAVIQNIYLYCASAGLNVVVRASIDRPALHKALGLKPDQKVIVSQTVGFPP